MHKNLLACQTIQTTSCRALGVLNIITGTYNSTSIGAHYDEAAISANTCTKTTTQHTSTGPVYGSFNVNDGYKDRRFDLRFSQTMGMNEVLTSFAAHGLMDEESDVFPSTPPRHASQASASLTPRIQSPQFSTNQAAGGGVMRSDTSYNSRQKVPVITQASTAYVGNTAPDPHLHTQAPSR